MADASIDCNSQRSKQFYHLSAIFCYDEIRRNRINNFLIKLIPEMKLIVLYLNRFTPQSWSNVLEILNTKRHINFHNFTQYQCFLSILKDMCNKTPDF